MARRGQQDSSDPREWSVRAAEAMAHAKTMEPGPERDNAMRLAEQLRAAAEMKGYLSSGELKAPD